MGKNVTKNRKARRKQRQRRYMRFGVLALLCVLGVGLMAGMALFNNSVKPNRDMQWYVRDGAVEVAAPAMGDGFSTTDRDSEFMLPEEGMRALPRRAEGTEEAPAQADQPQRADIVAEAQPEEAELPADEALPADEGFGAADIAAAEDLLEDGDLAQPGDGASVEAEPIDESESIDETEPLDGEEPIDGEESEPEEIVPSGPVTLTITAVGDCTFSGETGSKSNLCFLDYIEKYGYDYFFKGVRDIFEADDLTIANLEGPLTTSTNEKAHGYKFKADPACVEILSGSSVELCNVANNHSLDFGPEGLKETAQVLEGAGVGYCGYTAAYQATIKGVRVCALGFTKWDHTDEQIVEAITEARKNCDLLIVNMHWGWENQYDFCPQQNTTGHAAIDAGADLVIGTHPHVLQGIEKYKGKYIVYSLGNFCFAGNANPKDKRCYIFQQSFGFTPGMGIVQAGLVDEGINIIPATISSVPNTNDFQPTVLPAEQGVAVLKAIASHSKNFNAKETLWMKGNYLTQNGLMKTKLGTVAQGEAELADGETDAAEAGETTGTGNSEIVLPTDIWDDAEPFFSMGEEGDAAA